MAPLSHLANLSDARPPALGMAKAYSLEVMAELPWCDVGSRKTEMRIVLYQNDCVFITAGLVSCTALHDVRPVAICGIRGFAKEVCFPQHSIHQHPLLSSAKPVADSDEMGAERMAGFAKRKRLNERRQS